MALKPIRDFLELLLAPWTFVSDRCIFLWSYASALTHFKDYGSSSHLNVYDWAC